MESTEIVQKRRKTKLYVRSDGDWGLCGSGEGKLLGSEYSVTERG